MHLPNNFSDMKSGGDNRMKVCVLTLVYWPFTAGQGTRYPKVVCDLLANNFDLTVITSHHDKIHNKKLLIDKNFPYKVVRIPFIRFQKSGFIWRIINNISFSFGCLIAWRYLRKKSLIYTVSPDPPYYAFILPILKRLKSSKHIAVLTDMLPDVAFDVGIVKSAFLKKIIKNICVRAYKNTDHITVITQSLKSRLVDYGMPSTKVSVVELAVDTEKFKPMVIDPAVLNLGHLSGKFIVMYSGSFGHMYDFDIFFDSAKSVGKITDKIHFVIRGDGEQKDFISSRIADLNLNNVTQLGSESDPDRVISFINLASVCIVPIRDSRSIDMTHPSKIIEFWACKKPVICTSTGEVAHMISVSKAGIAISPGDTSGMINAILRLFQNQDLLFEMAENGRRFVQNEFSYKIVEKKLADVIHSLK